jgi:hypothetical protein
MRITTPRLTISPSIDPEALAGAARQARAGILALYAAWDAAEPGQGIGAHAERWQAKFPAEA